MQYIKVKKNTALSSGGEKGGKKEYKKIDLCCTFYECYVYATNYGYS